MRRHPTSLVLLAGALASATQAAGPRLAWAQADHDRDGVPDVDDDCPTDPGTAANRGCPGDPTPTPKAPAAEPLVEVSAGSVEIKRSIEFETGSATLRPSAAPILEAVAQAILGLPADARVLVRGHTDDRGAAASNVRLSARRAESVRKRLHALGVPEARLEAEGVGPREPVADNGSEEGRAKNRRVEFQILGPEGRRGKP